MKIGIFGGSFNPPHKMHLNIGKYLVNKHYVDKIIYVPTGNSYTYKSNLINDEHRCKMLELLIKNDKRLEISTYELKDYVVYTYETLAHFKSLYPDDDIYFVCGVDNLSYIDKWKNGEDILNNYNILVVDRNTNNLNDVLKKLDNHKDSIQVVPMELSNVSSTNIRNLIKDKKDDLLKELLDEKIIKYIRKEHLYEE